jgi:alpha-ketoglutarate-dependent taurine dioxygenase
VLSDNPNITWDIVQAHPEKSWDYIRLSENKMENSKEFFIRQKHQEWFRKSELYEELIAKVWHPSNIKRWKYYDTDLFDDMDFFDC